LPGGASEDMMDKVWDEKNFDWRKTVKVLERYLLLELSALASDTEKVYTLKASMIDYTCATLSKEDSEECQQLIFDYYADKLEKIYNGNMMELMSG